MGRWTDTLDRDCVHTSEKTEPFLVLTAEVQVRPPMVARKQGFILLAIFFWGGRGLQIYFRRYESACVKFFGSSLSFKLCVYLFFMRIVVGQ